ncbi:NADH-quinone oxidoreductase subunit C [candidate division NPL-UPA2 bacterium]|nr:NADH-quinone oxidoreductase subunit C [candidate division NPL-UPA2 bacterium]
MVKKDVLKEIKDKFSERILKLWEKSPRRIYIDLKAEDIPGAASFIFKALKARFVIASGVDTRQHIEILYHFAFDELGKIISLRTLLDRRNPEIESLTSIITGTEWIEREIHELLGVNFRNHPDLRKLLMPEDYPPEGEYPLRRDFK